MVRIVNGEIVPDDHVPARRGNESAGPQSPQGPQQASFTNHASQQYAYEHPQPPRGAAPPASAGFGGAAGLGAGAGSFMEQLDRPQQVFGQPVLLKFLLAAVALAYFVGGGRAALLVGALLFVGSSDYANQLIRARSRPARHGPPVARPPGVARSRASAAAAAGGAGNAPSGFGAVVGSFFASIFNPGAGGPPGDNDEQVPNGPTTGNPSDPRGPPPRFGTIGSLHQRR